MNLNERIAQDAQERIEQLTAQANEAQAIVDWANRKIADYEDELMRATSGEETKHDIQWLTTDNLQTLTRPTAVEVHSPTCQDLQAYFGDPAVRAGLTEISGTEQWATPEDFARDYNADFYAESEDGESGCWTIAFFPCTGMVTRTTTMTGYEK